MRTLNLKERKEARFNSGLADTLSPGIYNLVIGVCIVYGFILNAILIATCSEFAMGLNPIVLLIGYLVVCFLGIHLILSDSPLVSFVGYNLVVVPIGLVLSISIPGYPIGQIMHAIIITGCIFVIMTCLATLFPQIFAKLGRVLFISLIVLIVTELLALLIFHYVGTIFSWAGAIIFTLYIGYDWYVAQAAPKTLDNAIDSACELYLDLINLFLDFLRILDRD